MVSMEVFNLPCLEVASIYSPSNNRVRTVSSYCLQEGCIQGLNICQFEMWEIWFICFLLNIFMCSKSICSRRVLAFVCAVWVFDQLLCPFFYCVLAFSVKLIYSVCMCLENWSFDTCVIKTFLDLLPLSFNFCLWCSFKFLCIWVYQFYSFLVSQSSPHT